MLHLLLAVAGFEHFEGFDGFGCLERDFFTLVQAFASKIGFWGEDLFPGCPPALNPVAVSSFVLGFFVFGAEFLEEGLVDGELVGADGFGGEGGLGEGDWDFGGEERRTLMVVVVVGFGGFRVQGFREGEEMRCLEDLHLVELLESGESMKWKCDNDSVVWIK